jgi:hypothetical protein
MVLLLLQPLISLRHETMRLTGAASWRTTLTSFQHTTSPCPLFQGCLGRIQTVGLRPHSQGRHLSNSHSAKHRS